MNEDEMVAYAMNETNKCLCGVSFIDQNLKSFTYKIRYSYSPKSADPLRYKFINTQVLKKLKKNLYLPFSKLIN